MKYLIFFILILSFNSYASESYFMCVDLEQDEQILLFEDVHDVNRFSFYHPILKSIKYDIYFKKESTELKVFKVDLQEKTVTAKIENMHSYEWVSIENNIACVINNY